MTDDLHTQDFDLLVELLRVASTISRPMRDGVADPSGLSANELRVLMCLGGEGEMAGHELADVMGMQPMNVSRALATLAERGWVEQVRDANNRRRKPHRLTEAGENANKGLVPKVSGVAAFLFDGISARDRQAFSKVMERLILRIEAWPDNR